MKNIFTILYLALLNFSAAAQGYDFFDINNIKARINADGHLFWDEVGTASFEVPKGNGIHSIFAGGLWIGGYDNNGMLRTAAQTYRYNGGDFWPGPVGTDTLNSFWHRVWKISQEEIDTFVYEFSNGFPNANYLVPEVIQNWPGSDSSSSLQLLSYVDSDHDGIYNYLNGDYPCIKGDQAVAFIINDLAGDHHETGGVGFGLEIHGMAYGFHSADSVLNNTLFLNYKIISRNVSSHLDSCYIGNWTDFDLGNYFDDYTGCDVSRNMYYVYNGDNNDEGASGYGMSPPAQGVVFLKGPASPAGDGMDNNRDSCIDCTRFITANGDSVVPDSLLPEYLPMTNFVSYSNNHDPVEGFPYGPDEFYGYMRSIWRNGNHQTYGGDGHYGGMGSTVDLSDYMFPGDSDPLFWGTYGLPEAPWDEVTAGNMPGDRLCIGSSGSFTMNPGSALCIDYAYVFARSLTGGSMTSLDSLKVASDHVREFYNARAELNQCECQQQITPSVSELNDFQNISLYPNPASENLTLQFHSMKPVRTHLVITDMLGKEVIIMPIIVSSGKNTIGFSVSSLPDGVYFLKLLSESSFSTMKVVKH